MADFEMTDVSLHVECRPGQGSTLIDPTNSIALRRQRDHYELLFWLAVKAAGGKLLIKNTDLQAGPNASRFHRVTQERIDLGGVVYRIKD